MLKTILFVCLLMLAWKGNAQNAWMLWMEHASENQQAPVFQQWNIKTASEYCTLGPLDTTVLLPNKTTHFNASGNIVSTLLYDGSGDSLMQAFYAYDPSGHKKSRNITYLLKGISLENDRETFVYDLNGNLLFFEMAKAQSGEKELELTFMYEGKTLHSALKKTAGLDVKETFVTLPDGKVSQSTVEIKPSGKEKWIQEATLKYLYDAKGNFSEIAYITGSSTDITQYVYNEKGQLITLKNGISGEIIETYQYNEKGLLIRKEIPGIMTCYTFY